MNIKHDDIITLENGDTVKVSLELLHKKVTELVVGKEYKLQYDGAFCHTKGCSSDEGESIKNKNWMYVGEIPVGTVGNKGRHIFYASVGGMYSMWGTRSLDFVVKEV